MKILLVDCGRHWRGGQQQTLLLHQGLVARGLDVRAVARAGSPLLLRLRETGARAQSINPLNDADPRAAVKLLRIARSMGATIAHASDSRAHALLLAAGMLSPRPALVVSRRVTVPPTAGFKYRTRRVTRYIAVSQAVARGLINAGVRQDRISVVPSGIDLPDQDGLDPADRPRRAAYIGFLSAEKGAARSSRPRCWPGTHIPVSNGW